MSSPKELISQVDLTSGEILIPAGGRFLSYRALCEALNCELEGKVWQIVGRTTTPEGVQVSYKAMPTYQWELLQAKLDPKDWPMLPQDEKHRRDLHRRGQVELAVMTLTSLLFAILLSIGSMTYSSNANYEKGLEAILRGRSHSAEVRNMPQKKWVASVNELTNELAGQGYELNEFEVNSKGGWVKVNTPHKDASNPMEVLENIWPDVNFVQKKGGYQWRW